MTEFLDNHEQAAETQIGTGWEKLREVQFNAEQASDKVERADDGEQLNQRYETELLGPENVRADIESFVIRDGKVFDRSTHEEILDDDVVLRVKTSRFLFNEAINDRNQVQIMLGKRFKDAGPDYYIEKMMQKYAIRDEENIYGPNKLVRALMEKDEVTENILGDTVEGSKFDMFCALKQEYGKALIERKLRQHGMRMTDFVITLDDSRFQKDGYSTVNVKLGRQLLDQEQDEGLHHPAADIMRELDAKLLDAKQKGDRAGARRILMELRKAVSEQPLTVTKEQFQQMPDDERERYFKLKYKEAQVLGSQKMKDYWKQKIMELKG